MFVVVGVPGAGGSIRDDRGAYVGEALALRNDSLARAPGLVQADDPTELSVFREVAHLAGHPRGSRRSAAAACNSLR